MSELNHLFTDLFPEAAVLLEQGMVRQANPLARHYLPQLDVGSYTPPFLPAQAPSSGTFTAGQGRYTFRLTHTEAGDLLLFSPAPQHTLTDGQLDGAVRQLRTIMGDMLMGADDPAAFQKSFHRLFRLVDNLDFLRLSGQEGGLLFQPGTLDLAGLCRQVTAQAATLLGDRGVTLDFQSPLPSLLIPGDSALLQRLLLELISNSVKAVGRGTVFLRLHTTGGRAILTLSDSGSPLSDRQLAAMLQQDSDQLLPLPGAGAGMGLSVVRQIAALHGGFLLVEWGAGAPTVVLSLPAGPLDPSVSVQSPRLQQDGGLSPLLVALSDVLPTDLFAPEP